jgi:tetratricopeptide (TPR) repeat protein
VDLAESNAVLAGLGEGRDGASRPAYLALLRNAVAAHHGFEQQRHDDAVLAAFDTPSDAVACAVAIQRATRRHDRQRSDRLDVCIGIHLGETAEQAVSGAGEYTPRPAIHAQQLCEVAEGGQILVSDLVAALARSDTSLTFERAGLVDLVGGDEPAATFEVHYQGTSGELPPMPPELAARPRGRCSLVGRESDLERLRVVWAAAAAGGRRLAFVTGEPGIGKSRLAAEFAAEVHAGGAVVLSGRSFEESIVPYQPFVEALRQYVADCDPADLESQLGADPAPLVTLVPELTTRLPLRVAEGLGEDERYRLFDAVAALLSTISMGAPVLLVLDDLQWADPATLLLLKHVILDPRPASLLILGLFRSTEVTPTHPLTQLKADVGRDFHVDGIALSGLDDDDVASMFDSMIGWSPPPQVARGLRSDTEGNPFFLQEVIAQLDETGIAADRERMARGHLVAGELGVPTRVRDFVARRMQRLSPEALEVLGVAAIVGTEFELGVLAVVLASDPDRLVDRLDEAVDARLIVEVPGRAGSYAFSHALFQGALHEWHGANRRASLHARVAEAIETLRPDDPTILSDLARHYALTAGRYAAKVVHYGAAAGDRAFAQLAYEDAIEEYSRALDALPLVASADDRTRAGLLVHLGEAHSRVGDAAAAKSAFLAAAEQCVGEGSYDLLARAALGYGGTGKFGTIFDPFEVVNETLVGLLERAIEACPRSDETTRVRLLGWLAQSLYWSDDKERMLALSQEALDSARLIGDPSVIAHALHSRHVALWGPDHIPELRSAAEEMLALGRSTGDRDLQLKAYTWLITDALQTDPIEVVDEYIAGYADLAAELHRPYLLGYAESMRAARDHLDGRFGDMVRAMDAQLAHSEGADALRAQEAHRWQRGLLLLDLGRVDDDLIADLADLAQRHPGLTFGVMLALADTIADRREEAWAALAGLTPGDLASIPKDCMWEGTLAMLSRVVTRLEVVEYARPLYDLLAPYAERSCLWGSGFIVFGPVSRFLGMLATTFGEPDLAIDHLRHALEHSGALGSAPLVAWAKVELARALLLRGADGDDGRAQALLEEAARTGRELGMPTLIQDAEALSATMAASAVHGAPDGA